MIDDPTSRHSDFLPILPWGIPPPVVRILIVTDDDGSFSVSHEFGLTELIATLETTKHVYVDFKLTKAHRSKASNAFPFPAEADIQEFKFDDPKLFPADFDQLWLIGNLAGQAATMPDTEVKAIAQFMDQGGGVLATGDHQDLGGALCGRIPRVRSMRKWTFDYKISPDKFDPASGHSPPVQGPFRHDTLVAGHDPEFSFNDQSDDVPATIFPRLFGWLKPFKRPHPLLCGPNGMIDVLPDHMHEGECVTPTDLTKSDTFAGYTCTEYPSGDQGQVVPQVIADGEVFAHITDNPEFGFTDGMSNAKTFGVVGAYDGHEVKVGRVVVDSTFHHFVNINVIGSGAESTDPLKHQGFPATPEGQEAYDKIRAYWRNIATWLGGPGLQTRMFNATLWSARWDSQVRMANTAVRDREQLTWPELVQFGVSVQATMARFSSPCLQHAWMVARENPLAKYKWWLRLTLPDPPWELNRAFINPEEYLAGLVGCIMTELARAAPTRESRLRLRLDEAMVEIVRDGFALAAKTAAQHYESRMEETSRMLAAIREAG